MNKELSGAIGKIANVDTRYEEIVNWWQRKGPSTAEEYDLMLSNFNIVFACNSSNIENIPVTYHMTRELFQDGKVTNYTGAMQHLLELQNQKFAYEFILKSLEEGREIDAEFVLKLHKIMLHGCYDERRYSRGERPGSFKKNDYCVGVSEVGSYPEDVAKDIEELLKEVNETSGDALRIASYLHLCMENIHPFADGNGRVGRTLMNYYLMLRRYPPTVIFNEDKETYYLALEVFDKAEQIDGFVKFVKEQTVKTWKNIN